MSPRWFLRVRDIRVNFWITTIQQGRAMQNLIPKAIVVAAIIVPLWVAFSINNTGQTLAEHFRPQMLSASEDGRLSTGSDLGIQGLSFALALVAGAIFSVTPIGKPFVYAAEIFVDWVDEKYAERFEVEEEETDEADEAETTKPSQRQKWKTSLVDAQKEGDWHAYNIYAAKLGMPLSPVAPGAIPDPTLAPGAAPNG